MNKKLLVSSLIAVAVLGIGGYFGYGYLKDNGILANTLTSSTTNPNLTSRNLFDITTDDTVTPNSATTLNVKLIHPESWPRRNAKDSKDSDLQDGKTWYYLVGYTLNGKVNGALKYADGKPNYTQLIQPTYFMDATGKTVQEMNFPIKATLPQNVKYDNNEAISYFELWQCARNYGDWCSEKRTLIGTRSATITQKIDYTNVKADLAVAGKDGVPRVGMRTATLTPADSAIANANKTDIPVEIAFPYKNLSNAFAKNVKMEISIAPYANSSLFEVSAVYKTKTKFQEVNDITRLSKDIFNNYATGNPRGGSLIKDTNYSVTDSTATSNQKITINIGDIVANDWAVYVVTLKPKAFATGESNVQIGLKYEVSADNELSVANNTSLATWPTGIPGLSFNDTPKPPTSLPLVTAPLMSRAPLQ